MGTGPSRQETPMPLPKDGLTNSTTMPVAKVSKDRGTSVPLSDVFKSKEKFMEPVEVVEEPMEEPKKVPHRYEDIIKDADNASVVSLDDHIQDGVFLNNKKKKYWVEGGCNCFILFARELLITWSEDPQYWKWISLKETGDVEIEAASLLSVCWLEVHGRLETSYLTPGTSYEVVFAVMMMNPRRGWTAPVNLRLKLPNGSVQQHEDFLQEKPEGQWIELKAGEFTTHQEQEGEMEFSLFDYEGGQWKQGLIVKCAIIRPRK